MDTIAPIAIANAEHYRWGEACDGSHLLKLDELGVIRERVPSGAAEMPHRHARSRQFFYVLDSAAIIEVDGVRHVLAAGQGPHVPPGVAHQFRNESPADVRRRGADGTVLVVSASQSHGDRENLDTTGASA